MQEIQFLDFMGGSNLMHAHSNYLICMCFITIHTIFWSHFVTFLQIVEVLRHFVMLLAVTSIFNKAQSVQYTRVVVQ